MTSSFTLNGSLHSAEHAPGTTLMDHLRSLGLASVKHGCESGECGACTVLVDSLAMNSCMLLVATLGGRTVETVEHLSTHGTLHSLQQVFLEEGAVQCGFCTPGMILSLEALFRRTVCPDESEIRDALAGTLCRCTGYVKPVGAAIRLAAQARGGER